MVDFNRAAAIIRSGCADAAFPAASVEVGDRGTVIWREAFGSLTYDADSSPATEDTLFDLASLTKVLATTNLAIQLIDQGRLTLEDRIGHWLPEWRGSDRDDVRVRALLSHSAGLTAWLPFYRDYAGRREFEHAICELPLEYPPGTQAVYSDLGFILLGFILENAGGAAFADQAQALLMHLTPGPLLFNPALPPAPLLPSAPAALSAERRSNIAPTEQDPWRGRLLIGDVHDENAWALGGAAGHAGLFGAVSAVGDVARATLAALEGRGSGIVREFVKRTDAPGSSRALGWDTMLRSSSCGSRMSAAAIGHTGYTGTSLWIDPEAGVYVVFLTNRVHPTRKNDAIQRVRPMLHDAIMDAIQCPR